MPDREKTRDKTVIKRGLLKMYSIAKQLLGDSEISATIGLRRLRIEHEKSKLMEIERRLSMAKHLLDGIKPVFHQVDRRKQSLESEISQLEKERLKLTQGQLLLKLDI